MNSIYYCPHTVELISFKMNTQTGAFWHSELIRTLNAYDARGIDARFEELEMYASVQRLYPMRMHPTQLAEYAALRTETRRLLTSRVEELIRARHPG